MISDAKFSIKKRRKWERCELIGTGGTFINRTPMDYALRSRTDKWNLMKLGRFCKAKDIANKTKW